MPSHHRITLVVREEPEGHGTLFLDWGGSDQESLEALAVIPKRGMDGDPTALGDRLGTILVDFSRHIAGAMVDATIDGPLLPIGAERVTEAMERVAGERSADLMRLISWLIENYHVRDGDSDEMDDAAALLNAYTEKES